MPAKSAYRSAPTRANFLPLRDPIIALILADVEKAIGIDGYVRGQEELTVASTLASPANEYEVFLNEIIAGPSRTAKRGGDVTIESTGILTFEPSDVTISPGDISGWRLGVEEKSVGRGTMRFGSRRNPRSLGHEPPPPARLPLLGGVAQRPHAAVFQNVMSQGTGG